jgi:hypothetical protein
MIDLTYSTKRRHSRSITVHPELLHEWSRLLVASRLIGWRGYKKRNKKNRARINNQYQSNQIIATAVFKEILEPRLNILLFSSLFSLSCSLTVKNWFCIIPLMSQFSRPSSGPTKHPAKQQKQKPERIQPITKHIDQDADFDSTYRAAILKSKDCKNDNEYIDDNIETFTEGKNRKGKEIGTCLKYLL